MVGAVGHAEGWRMIRKTALIATGIAIGAGCVALGQQARSLVGGPAMAAPADTYKNLSLFGDIFDKVRTDYVEKPDEQKMVEAAINGMLTSLDPHSSYLDAKGFKDMRTQTEGKFGGLGIEVTQEDGFVKVVSPIDDTPASRAGIQSGDLIAGIDDENVQGLTLNQAVEKMRGAINTTVKLTILRGKDKQKLDVKLTRAEIHIKSVKSHKQDEDIGYIRISRTASNRRCSSSSRRFPPTSSRATSSICATIRAACSTNRSRSSTRSSITARSCRRAVATPTKRNATTRVPAAISPRASR
jgi:carboxyl-terminal processing protease